jgi:nucleoside-diphosphate-sugar epimerase
MRIFIAGAGGAIGRALVPLLLKAGHQVCGMSHSATGAEVIRSLGAQPVTADALDREAVVGVVASARPDVIVHQLTALPKKLNVARFDRELAPTNQLRTVGTANLIAAAAGAGVRRIVAQSFAGWPYARQGGQMKTEADPLDPDPPPALRESLNAIRYLEAQVTETPGIDGIALRYGFLYGAVEQVAGVGTMIPDIRRRFLPVLGAGTGVWSFIHIDDVVSATLAAIERAAPGIYNIVDDEPAPVSTWLPELALIVGAKRPLHVPVWLGRLAIGEVGVLFMTSIRGASNGKAKRELQWTPRWSTWRDGFRHEFSRG